MSTPSTTDTSPRVRLDDVARGVGYEFDELIDVFAARAVDDVRDVLATAEAAAIDGRWVVGFVTYDAARAFDVAFPDTGRGASGPLPLAWFAAYGSRREVTLVTPPTEAPTVDGLHRVDGSDRYRHNVEEVRTRIERGDVYQANLTDRVRGTFDGDPYDLYRSMVSTQGGSFNAYLDLGDTVVVSASPELFLQIDDDTVTTRPMKGTRRRHGRADLDADRATALRRSPKDLAENVMIVDLLRNDLSRVSAPGGVSVPDLFRVERYETVWQLTSTVAARLRPEVGLVDVFAAAFPCGSITGAPKVSAMHIIDQLESTSRGLYCGAIGVLAPAIEGARPASVWSVAIRTAVLERRPLSECPRDETNHHVEFGTGGGITYDSVPADEDDELESKTDVLRSARPEFQLLETLRIDEKGVHHLAMHLRRLAASAAYFGFLCDTDVIARAVMAVPPSNRPRRLRLRLHRDGRASIETTLLGAAPEVVRLAVSCARVRSDDPFMCHKTTRRHTYEAARAAHPDADDVVLVNERDEVVETTIANLLYRLDGQWFTPPLTSGGLAGIGREVLLAYGVVGERTLSLVELATCEAIEVVSSLRGRRPATMLQR